MHIFLNATGASAGSGLTYLYNVVPRLSSMPGTFTTLLVREQLRAEFRHLPLVEVVDVPIPAGSIPRLWFEQKQLPGLIRAANADVLLSVGNFALRSSPVPQILLSGNSLYTSRDFYRDLRQRRHYSMWADTKVRGFFAKKSVHWADCTVAPSRAFADDLERWTGQQVDSVHHGFDAGVFFADNSSLPSALAEKIATADGCLKLLFVSHYNYYRNFETLFRAVALLGERAAGLKIRLLLTCALDDRHTPGAYRTGFAAQLIRDLGIREQVIELGAVPYRQLHHLYRACDIYVTPAYAETFAHPLVEAMACGLPVIASDIPAHREICRSAVYFDRFSAEQLAQRILEIAAGVKGKRVAPQAVKFSWSEHVAGLMAIAARLKANRNGVTATPEDSLQAAS